MCVWNCNQKPKTISIINKPKKRVRMTKLNLINRIDNELIDSTSTKISNDKYASQYFQEHINACSKGSCYCYLGWNDCHDFIKAPHIFRNQSIVVRLSFVLSFILSLYFTDFENWKFEFKFLIEMSFQKMKKNCQITERETNKEHIEKNEMKRTPHSPAFFFQWNQIMTIFIFCTRDKKCFNLLSCRLINCLSQNKRSKNVK